MAVAVCAPRRYVPNPDPRNHSNLNHGQDTRVIRLEQTNPVRLSVPGISPQSHVTPLSYPFLGDFSGLRDTCADMTMTRIATVISRQIARFANKRDPVVAKPRPCPIDHGMRVLVLFEIAQLSPQDGSVLDHLSDAQYGCHFRVPRGLSEPTATCSLS